VVFSVTSVVVVGFLVSLLLDQVEILPMMMTKKLLMDVVDTVVPLFVFLTPCGWKPMKFGTVIYETLVFAGLKL
jgi:hypothetical protein